MTRHDTTEHGTTRHNTSVSLLLEVESGGVPCVSEKDGGRSEGPSMHNYRGGPNSVPIKSNGAKSVTRYVTDDLAFNMGPTGGKQLLTREDNHSHKSNLMELRV